MIVGGPMSYGASLRDGFYQTGIYVAKRLAGAKPSDLRVLQSAKFELMINRRTAKSRGIDLPDSLLALSGGGSAKVRWAPAVGARPSLSLSQGVTPFWQLVYSSPGEVDQTRDRLSPTPLARNLHIKDAQARRPNSV